MTTCSLPALWGHSNAFIRPLLGLPAEATGMIQLGQFLTFWAAIYAVVTVYVAVFKKEVCADGTR